MMREARARLQLVLSFPWIFLDLFSRVSRCHVGTITCQKTDRFDRLILKIVRIPFTCLQLAKGNEIATFTSRTGCCAVLQAQTPRDVTRSLRVVIVISTRGNITYHRHAVFLSIRYSHTCMWIQRNCNLLSFYTLSQQGMITMGPQLGQKGVRHLPQQT